MSNLGRTGFGAVLAMILTDAVLAAPCTWNVTTGNWTNATKWVDGSVPQAGDTVTLPAGSYTVTLDNVTYDLASYTQNGGILFFTNWATCLRAAEVTFNTGKMNHALCDTNTAPGVTNRVYIAGSNVTIGAAAMIDVAGRGFPGTTNVGMGPGGGAVYCWGGSYGGVGGRGHATLGSSTPGYGITNAPIDPGSGGGGGNSASYYGAAGGGVVRIDASGTVQVDGTISATGMTAVATRGGGGAGGSIYLSKLPHL